MNYSSPRSRWQRERADTLVAVVSRDHDLQTFLDHRTYRIPDRVLGRSLARGALQECRVLALYQSSRITAGLPSAIEWWGDVEEVETRLRGEICPDEPDHPAAEELYHVVRVRRVNGLPSPLMSRFPRRITFLRTSRERLLAAEQIGDLPLGTPFTEQLIEAVADHLKSEVSEEPVIFELARQTTMEVGGVAMEVDFGLYTEDGEVGVICDGGDLSSSPERLGIVHFSAVRPEPDLDRCVADIMRELERSRSG